MANTIAIAEVADVERALEVLASLRGIDDQVAGDMRLVAAGEGGAIAFDHAIGLLLRYAPRRQPPPVTERMPSVSQLVAALSRPSIVEVYALGGLIAKRFTKGSN